MNQLSTDNLDMALFTGELVQQKLAEITDLEADQTKLAHLSSALVREAAASAYNQQMSILCMELGELALDIPVTEVTEETSELRVIVKQPEIEAESAATSVMNFGSQLAALLPFAASAITYKANEAAASIKPPESQAEIDEADKRRLEKLEAIETVLLTPITSPTVINQLLSYFERYDSDNDQEALAYLRHHSQPLALKELLRQMTATTARPRILEYFSAFATYPIEVTVLADAVYLHDERDRTKKHTIMGIVTNPKQTSGRATYRELAKKGLVLQHGWVIPASATDKPAKKKRVIRSLHAQDYSENDHVGAATDGNEKYLWEGIGETELKQAKE